MTAHTIDSPVTHRDSDGQWMTGDLYEETAGESLDRIAELVYRDVLGVQYDELIPAAARFTVRADETGPVGILYTTITGLFDDQSWDDQSWDDDQSPIQETPIQETMRMVFDLAGHYNKVNLTQPHQARFIHHISAISEDSTPYCVYIGVMWGTGARAL